MIARTPGKPLCVIQGCPNLLITKEKGFCNFHWNRWKRYGDPMAGPPKKKFRREDAGQPRWWDEEDPEIEETCLTGCRVLGCELAAKYSGLCSTHYSRYHKFGRVGPLVRPKRIPTWHLDKNGYMCKFVDGRKFYQHRETIAAEMGRLLESWENVHHKNGLRSDNRLENLELWAKPQYAGQSVDDLIDFVVEYYKEKLIERLV